MLELVCAHLLSRAWYFTFVPCKTTTGFQTLLSTSITSIIVTCSALLHHFKESMSCLFFTLTAAFSFLRSILRVWNSKLFKVKNLLCGINIVFFVHSAQPWKITKIISWAHGRHSGGLYGCSSTHFYISGCIRRKQVRNRFLGSLFLNGHVCLREDESFFWRMTRAQCGCRSLEGKDAGAGRFLARTGVSWFRKVKWFILLDASGKLSRLLV